LYSTAPAWAIPDAEVEALRRDFPDVDVTRASSVEELKASIGEAEILFSWEPGEEAMSKAERLRWLHAPAAGIGAYLRPSFLKRRAVITNSRGAHAIPIAEHVVGVLVALARRFRAAVVEQTTTGMRRENWWVGSEIPDELHGKTLGLFGYGAIGREVARRAIGFGMRVVALRRHPDRAPEWDPELLRALGLPLKEPDVEAVLGPADFARLLGESDAVVACAVRPRHDLHVGSEATIVVAGWTLARPVAERALTLVHRLYTSGRERADGRGALWEGVGTGEARGTGRGRPSLTLPLRLALTSLRLPGR